MNGSRLQSIAPTLVDTILQFSKIERLNAMKKIIALAVKKPEIGAVLGVDLIEKLMPAHEFEKGYLSLVEANIQLYDDKYFELAEANDGFEITELALQNFSLARAFASIYYALNAEESNDNLCEAVFEANVAINDIETLTLLIKSCKVI